jgi:site-specific recombinase XerD
MIQDLKIRNRKPSTIKAYIYHVRCFAEYFGKSPEVLGPEQVRDWQVHLVENKKVSWSSFNQAVCALRFLYDVTLPRPWPVRMIPFGKRPKTLPTVLGPDEVQTLLACTYPIKHRVILTTLYAAGLRLEEALHLVAADIDSARMLLRVACGKGAKERLVPLSPRLLETLRDYWRMYRPEKWLFPGRKPHKPLSESAVQRCCKRAVREAGLQKHATPHTLRHSYATGLLEAGVDLLTISRLLGHRSFSTTLIYLHVRRPHLESVPSPLDWLPLDQCAKSLPPTTPASSSPPPSPNDSNSSSEAGPPKAAPTKRTSGSNDSSGQPASEPSTTKKRVVRKRNRKRGRS